MSDTGYQIGPNLPRGERPFRDGWETDAFAIECPHDAWESVLYRPRYLRMEECVRCVECHSPRCGHSGEDNPCQLVRHHRIHHVLLSGQLDPVGGYKCANGIGCGCGARFAS